MPFPRFTPTLPRLKGHPLSLLMAAALLFLIPIPFEASAADTPSQDVVAARSTPLRVVTSIAPVHSLASWLVGEQGPVTLLVPPGSSPHTYSLRPSAAAQLAEADVVFWIGPAMEMFLPRILDSLPRHAQIVSLSDLPGVAVLPLRHGGVWGEGHHHHGEEATDDHDHEANHEDDDHHDDDDHDDHDDHDHDTHDAHTAAMTDPHQWLDPQNARLWAAAMADTLAQADPHNAALYHMRAQALDAALQGLQKDLAAELAPVAGVPYMVFHDAYHYFEDRFGLTPVGALSIDPSQSLGARRIASLRAHIRDSGARCVFGEPQFSQALPTVLSEDNSVRLAVADPLGQAFPPGRDQYFLAQRALAKAFHDCLSP
jgi:zinc transport system substrate-binding protein